MGFKRLIFGNGLFVAVTKSGAKDGGPITTSTDGRNWTTPVYVGGTYAIVNDVAYGNGRFVAVGSVYVSGDNKKFSVTSTDGRNWSTPKTIGGSTPVYAIGYGNGKFVAGNLNGEITVSTDGVNWSPMMMVQSDMQIHRVIYDKGKFVMIGTLFNPYGGYVLTSVYGENWSEPQQVSNKPLSDVCIMPQVIELHIKVLVGHAGKLACPIVVCINRY